MTKQRIRNAVLRLKNKGLTYPQIATRLRISASTAQYYALNTVTDSEEEYLKTNRFQNEFKDKEVLTERELFESMAY